MKLVAPPVTFVDILAAHAENIAVYSDHAQTQKVPTARIHRLNDDLLAGREQQALKVRLATEHAALEPQ